MHQTNADGNEQSYDNRKLEQRVGLLQEGKFPFALVAKRQTKRVKPAVVKPKTRKNSAGDSVSILNMI